MKVIEKLSKREQEKYELNEKKLKFLQFIMLPKALRPHRAYICARLDITEYQYFSWLQNKKINEARRALVKEYYKDDVPDVINAMKMEALAGNPMAAKLFLEYVDDFNKEEKKKEPFVRPDMLPPQEINAIIINLEQKFYGNNQPGTSGQPTLPAGSQA